MGQTENDRNTQCESECVNMYGPNLIICRPPGPVIRYLIKEIDKRKEKTLWRIEREKRGGDVTYMPQYLEC